MKALILSAGEGIRLRPLTSNIPKCMLPVNGKPLVRYWLEACEKAGFDEVLINGHYLAEQLKAYLEKARCEFSMKINYIYEPELLGTGGTLYQNRSFFENEKIFMMCHGDNFTNIDLQDFISFHKSKNPALSVALFETNVPRQCGIVEEMDADSRIIKFVEKPENPRTNLASAAIFLMSPDIFPAFPDRKVIDFSKEVLPKFQGRMFGYKIKGFNIDIGTIDNYNYANRVIKQ